ncbi:hypothetical protein IWW39_000641 [Coemansia spiralis]|uniref:Uncharacterized protein n=1 Tax=Coemansia spiralis TaxID=417178 RepID=A0A9W8GN84_9FUNG|nr:hypothetical protein IWW39_000641 [Coemansia spiralis]
MYPQRDSYPPPVGPYNFQPPTHTDSQNVSHTQSRLTYRGLPSNATVIRPFASTSSTMASGRVAKQPPSASGASGGGMMLPPLPPMMAMRGPPGYSPSTSQYHQGLPPLSPYQAPPLTQERKPLPRSPPHLHLAPRHSYHGDPYASIPRPNELSTSPSTPSFGKQSPPARKRSRHAWPADMTRQIINVLLDEFLNDPSFRTTIYRSREERDHRFKPSGRSILEEYNKVQNIRRRYFIPLSYLLQWDQLKHSSNARNRLRANIEKKLAKPLERSRLQMIFLGALRTPSSMPPSLSTSTSSVTLLNPEDLSGAESEAEESVLNVSTPLTAESASKPVFELDIFVTELKRRDPQLWAQGSAAFHSWVSRKCSVDYILNH